MPLFNIIETRQIHLDEATDILGCTRHELMHHVALDEDSCPTEWIPYYVFCELVHEKRRKDAEQTQAEQSSDSNRSEQA
jgi:hypothetical protein